MLPTPQVTSFEIVPEGGFGGNFQGICEFGCESKASSDKGKACTDLRRSKPVPRV